MVGNGIWSTGDSFLYLSSFWQLHGMKEIGTIPLKHGSIIDATNCFGFFNNGMAYTAPDILVSDGIHISQRGREVFPHELVGLGDRALS